MSSSTPQRETLISIRASYYIAPLVVNDFLRGELGFSLMYGSDTQKEHYGTWGLPARISIGNTRMKWYVKGVLSSAWILDLINIESSSLPYLSSISTGVYFTFGDSSNK